jgi:predicted pyridoxine 5'-phosphate oxidase superfamily flavin-nucleotide-binding protein
MTASPFHEGERAAQRWAGVPPSNGSFIRPYMPDQHRELFEKLPFILVGSIDESLQPSASLVAGAPGFVRTDADTLEVHAIIPARDALATNLRRGTRLGILGIEPHTRRRNRVNGYVLDVGQDSFTLLVEQSYGNCPKYITPRKLSYAPTPGRAATHPSTHSSTQPSTQLSTLSERERELITHADTFFIASAHPQALASNEPSHGVDVSHRGGPPGFVRFTGADTFVIPDYQGNNLFNTFGNIMENPKVGLLFWDLATQSVLALTAHAEPKQLPSPETGRSERQLQFRLLGARYLSGACPLRAEE